MGNATVGWRSNKTLGWDVDVWSGCAGGSTGCEETEAGSTGCGSVDCVGISGFSSSIGRAAATVGSTASIGSATVGASTLAVARVGIPRLVLARLANFPAFSAACAACAANFCSLLSLSAFLSLILFGLLGDGGLETVPWLFDCSWSGAVGSTPLVALSALIGCKVGSSERLGGGDSVERWYSPL